MAAEKRDAAKGLGLRSGGWTAHNLDVERFSGLRLEDWRMNGAGAGRLAGALLRDGGESLLIAAKLPHPAHHAMMLAVPAAAGGKIRIGAGTKDGCSQRPAEDDGERNCDCAAHGQVNSIGHGLLEEFLVDLLDFECFFHPASDVMPDHQAGKLASINKDESFA